MKPNRAAAWTFISVVALVSGCSFGLDGLIKGGKGPAPTTATEASPSTAPSNKLPIPDTSEAIGLRIMSHPRRNYYSDTGSYGYFIGGVLDGRYNPDAGILIISSADARSEPLMCKYSPQDTLYMPETGEAAEARAQGCKALRARLRTALSE